MAEKKLYNVWLSVETVIVDENGEELDWPDSEDVDEAKLLDLVSASEAENACNALLIGFNSPYTITIPREEGDGEIPTTDNLG